MKSFFRSSGVKAVAAILCIVCLSAALLSGLFLTAMLAVGEFDGSGSLQELALENQLSRDCHKVMYNYFDPSEPSAPWQSYYSEGIYTGENSNFRYNVVDAETGYSVLSTVVGGEQVRLRREYTHVFETEIQRPIQDRYTVSDIVFSSGGITYLYSEESDYFYPVYDENVLAYLSPINIGDEVFRLGFTYAAPDVPVVETAIVEPSAISPVYINESHFEYDGEGFFRSGASVEYVVELKEYTIIGYVLYDLEAPDEYSYRYETARIISGHRQDLILLFGITTVLGLVLLITLCRNVGRIKGQDAPVVPLGLRLPWDLMAAVLVFAGCLGFVLLDELRYIPNYQFEFPAVILVVLALTALAVYLLCIFCVRAKTHTLGRGSLSSGFSICCS